MNRKITYWKLRETELQLGARTLIMGVLNVTPDSFSDGGKFSDPDRAYARALELEEQGADIIDIGAESTRPGSQRISADEEWQRLVPILKRLRDQLRVPLSLDTYKSEIAERALDYGIAIINDPSGLTFDPGVAKVAANGNAGLILNHMRGLPESWAKLPPMPDPAGGIAHELEATVNRARHAGVDRARIVIDPGIGFGKRADQNAVILAHLRRLTALDYPVLVGVSRKSFLAQQTEIDTEFATAAAVAAAILNGAHIVRVHDVQRMRSAVMIADEIAQAAAAEAHSAEVEDKPRIQRSKPIDDQKARPTRPPMAKPAPVAPMASEAAAQPPVEAVEAPAEAPAEAKKVSAPPPRREFRAPDGGGFRPPARRPLQREGDRPRDEKPERRDFRPAAGAKRTFDRGPKRSFEPRGDSRPADPRGEKRPFSPRGEKPPFAPRGEKRSFEPRGGKRPFSPRGDKPSFAPRGDKPSFGPRAPRDEKRPFEPRGDKRPFAPRGEKRDGPPSRGDRPPFDRKGPPKRPFRKRP